MLHVTPSSENRRAFDRWAITQRVRTSSSNTFAVPDELFETIPEDVLVDAKVDGQPYVASSSSSFVPSAVETITLSSDDGDDDADDDADSEETVVDEADIEDEDDDDDDDDEEIESAPQRATVVPF